MLIDEKKVVRHNDNLSDYSYSSDDDSDEEWLSG